MALNLNNFTNHAKKLTKEIEADFEAYNKTIKHTAKRPPHLKILSETMKRYFEREIVVLYNWAPNGAPDPFIYIASRVEFPVFDLYPSKNLNDVARLIQEAFKGARIIHPLVWSTVSEGRFLCPTPPPIKQVKTEGDNILKCIAEPTCQWVATQIDNPTPLVGSPNRAMFLANMKSVMQNKSIIPWPDPAYIATLMMKFHKMTFYGLSWSVGRSVSMKTTFREDDWVRLTK